MYKYPLASITTFIVYCRSWVKSRKILMGITVCLIGVRSNIDKKIKICNIHVSNCIEVYPICIRKNISSFNMKFGIILIIYMYTCVHITCTFSYLSIGLLILSFDCEYYNDYNFPPILFLPHLPLCILW